MWTGVCLLNFQRLLRVNRLSPHLACHKKPLDVWRSELKRLTFDLSGTVRRPLEGWVRCDAAVDRERVNKNARISTGSNHLL